MRLSQEDHAPQITLDDLRLQASSRKGYCMVGGSAEAEAECRCTCARGGMGEGRMGRRAISHALCELRWVCWGLDRLPLSVIVVCMQARGNRGVFRGTWYYEVRVGSLGATGACRLGWATNQADLQGPVGGDEHGFAYRSVGGSKVRLWLMPPRRAHAS